MTATATRNIPFMTTSTWSGYRYPVGPEGFGDDIPLTLDLIDSAKFPLDAITASTSAHAATTTTTTTTAGLVPSPSSTPSPIQPIQPMYSGPELATSMPVSAVPISAPLSAASLSGLSGLVHTPEMMLTISFSSPRISTTASVGAAPAPSTSTAILPIQSPALGMPLSPAFYDPRSSGPMSGSTWFDPTVGAFDSPLGSTSAYSSYIHPTIPAGLSHFAMSAPSISSYPLPMTGPAPLDFTGSVGSIVPNPYLMPPSSASFDRMMHLPHSPELSPVADECRPAKRQRTVIPGAKSAISSNLLVSDQHLGNNRASPKGSRQDSAEAEDRKGQCPIPECGRVFKDLKAHMLTHQTERPEKCPITTCEYHLKGFARKYDKNRHTLTHYRGTMVCIFCPGAGTATEQAFNRVDVFKKHLTQTHGVEQAPPNSRKRNSSGRPIVHEPIINSAVSVISEGSSTSLGAPFSEPLCSTCSIEFRNPQEFYEHLDDCVLRVVQKLDPAEMYNERNLGTVVEDEAVVQTLTRHKLPVEVGAGNETPLGDDDQDDNHHDNSSDSGNTPGGSVKGKQGVVPQVSSRRRRRDYPNSWGCPSEKMNMKKRVVCVYNGSERIHKETTMVNRDYDVRIPLADGKSYITDMEMCEINQAENRWNSQHTLPGPELGLVPSVDGSELSVDDYPVHF